VATQFVPHVPTDRRPFTARTHIATGDTVDRELQAARVGYTIFVCHVQISVVTAAAAEITIHDDAGVPLRIVGLEPGVFRGPNLWDFGPDGIDITAQQALRISAPAGNEAAVVVHGYYQQTRPLSEAESRTA
jgi:hypothetical protein